MDFSTFFALTLGLSLSVCSGFRAIVPLFILALGNRFTDLVSLGSNFEWLSSTPALIALTCALVAEFVADKIPALDTIFDILQTPLRTASGAVTIIAPFVELPGWATAILVIIGGASALTVHGAKATVRATATATTGGLANPFISFLEDVFTWVMAILAIFIAPLIALVAIFTMIYLVRRLLRFLKNRKEEELDEESQSNKST
jgi:hypothetical protein